MSTKHAKAAKRFIANRTQEEWHNRTLWLVREKRDRMAMGVPEWEQLREVANKIKRHTISHLDTYLESFAKKAAENGAIIHWATDAAEHNSIIYEILKKHGAKKLVKSKSMLTEECHLNPHLIENGIDVVESDRSFSKTLVEGNGITAGLLEAHGIHVCGEGDFKEEKRGTGNERSNKDSN